MLPRSHCTEAFYLRALRKEYLKEVNRSIRLVYAPAEAPRAKSVRAAQSVTRTISIQIEIKLNKAQNK